MFTRREFSGTLEAEGRPAELSESSFVRPDRILNFHFGPSPETPPWTPLKRREAEDRQCPDGLFDNLKGVYHEQQVRPLFGAWDSFQINSSQPFFCAKVALLQSLLRELIRRFSLLPRIQRV